MKWACPKCGAEPDKHGKGACCAASVGPCCDGFLCDCDDDGTTPDHGETHAHPCPSAKCYHCGWEGKFPRPSRNMKAWEKAALAAGWTPPSGWEEALKESEKVRTA